MPKTNDVGVIVGRFQVHRLHDAHRTIINSIYTTHRHTVIVLGLSPVRVSTRNPLDFAARKDMLLSEFPKVTVLYLPDQPNDVKWSTALDELISTVKSPAQSVCLYGSRDSFLKHYYGHHPVEALEPTTYVSGTELRRDIAKGVRDSEDFRAGVIWASANGYPKVYPTIDVAIYRGGYSEEDVCLGCGKPFSEECGCPAGTGKRRVVSPRGWLMVRKPQETNWRFCGGFVDPTDVSYESAVRREVLEETGCDIGDPKFIASLRVDDWRYKNEDDKIITTLFVAPYVSGPVKPADDIVEAQWFDSVTLPHVIVDEHVPLALELGKKGWLQA